MEHQQQQELLQPVFLVAQVAGLACLTTNGRHDNNNTINNTDTVKILDAHHTDWHLHRHQQQHQQKLQE